MLDVKAAHEQRGVRILYFGSNVLLISASDASLAAKAYRVFAEISSTAAIGASSR